jgi:hypothetical protein
MILATRKTKQLRSCEDYRVRAPLTAAETHTLIWILEGNSFFAVAFAIVLRNAEIEIRIDDLSELTA